MGRTVILTVRLKFSEKIITDEDYLEIVDNVGDAIDNQIQNIGIAPIESDVLTDVVEITEQYSGARYHKSYVI